jgi:hypothetical protein
MCAPERFGNLYGNSLYWIAVRVNPADTELRNAEQALLYRLLDRASDEQAPAMLETLKPWDARGFMPEDRETVRMKTGLRNECVTRLLPKMERASVGYIGRPESLRLLSTPEGSPSFRYMLFFPDRLPWGTVIRTALLDTVQKAKKDLNAFQKTSEFLQLLVEAAADGSNYISRQSAATITSDREFITALWQGAISRHIQSLMLKSYLAKREALIQLGAQDDDLPLSPELAKAREASEMNESAAGDSG